MPSEPTKFWFPAKTFGWGWGVPVVWQGWVVLGAYGLLLGLGFAWLGARGGQVAAVVLTVLLVFICWLKGERPRWRWGDD